MSMSLRSLPEIHGRFDFEEVSAHTSSSIRPAGADLAIDDGKPESGSRNAVEDTSSITSQLLSKPEEFTDGMSGREDRAGQPRPSRWDRLISNTWFFESLAMAFSLASLLSIAIVLRVYEGKPTHPMPWGITLNAIVSTLATASKASLLCAVAGSLGQLKWCWFQKSRKLYDLQSFDDVSRGPAGSISLLLGRTRSIFAGTGAVITILTLVFDPFVQQIIRYSSRSVILADGSAITRMSRKFATYPPWGMEFVGAINSGLWSDSSQFDRLPSCSSGNCEWPVFDSLGWCSYCVDATSMVVLSGQCRVRKETQGNGTCRLSFGHGSDVPIYQSPSIGPTNSLHHLAVNVEYDEVVWPVIQAGPRLGSVTLPPPPPLNLRAAGRIISPPLTLGFASIRYKQRPQILKAEQCSLRPCSRTYKIQVKAGIPDVQIQSTDYGFLYYENPSLEPGASFLNTCWESTESNATFPNSTTSNSTDGNLLWASSTHTRFCSVDLYSYEVANRISAIAATEIYLSSDGGYAGTIGSNYSDVIVRILSHNLSYVVNNIAASLTSLALDLDNRTVTGTVHGSEGYVSVRWPWFILPALIEALGLLLFMVTVIRTHLEKVALWRSSLLPLLYCGLDTNTLAEYQTAYGLCGMGIHAKSTVVKLTSSGEDDGSMLMVPSNGRDDGTSK